MQEQKPETNKDNSKIAQIVAKVSAAENILIALSQNPTADELAGAIGLSLYLDKIGKHATAIYSGKTPSILEFLEPEQRLETNTDSLQDFIIAINKDKADHLRYKVEGDYVKVYITPYKTKISEEDLEFSHGDFNIGLVVSLNVPNSNSLDKALTSHGRILHDAETINIAAAAPGDFGNLQWSDPGASSVSEMVAELVFGIEKETGSEVDGDVATALLTGVFVATDRFSNERTQPETMNMAAKLMSLGANRQLISEYMKKGEEVVPEGGEEKGEQTQNENGGQEIIQNENVEAPVEQQGDVAEQAVEMPTEQLDIPRDNVQGATAQPEQQAEVPSLNVQEQASQEKVLNVNNPASDMAPKIDQLDFKPVENIQDNGLSQSVSPGIPTVNVEPISSPQPKVGLEQIATPFEETPAPSYVDQKDASILGAPSPQSVQNVVENPGVTLSDMGARSSVDESVMNELKNFSESSTFTPLGAETSQPAVSTSSYLGSNPAISAAPGVSEGPEENHIPGLDFSSPVGMGEDEPGIKKDDNSFIIGAQPTAESTQNVVSSMQPAVQPMQNTVPNATLEPRPQGMPMPGDEILPPPPTPPVDFGAVSTTSVSTEKPAPMSQSVSFLNLGQETASRPEMNMSTQISPGLPQVDRSFVGETGGTNVQPSAATPQSVIVQPEPVMNNNADPGAFKIPGM